MLEEQEREQAAATSDVDEALPKILCALIHEVLPEEATLARESPQERGPKWRETWQERGLILHHSYVGAAVALHRQDPRLISAEQVAEVSRRAVDNFDAARWSDEKWGKRWESAEDALRVDLAQADKVVAAAELPTLLRLRSRKSLFEELACESSHNLGAFKHYMTEELAPDASNMV